VLSPTTKSEPIVPPPSAPWSLLPMKPLLLLTICMSVSLMGCAKHTSILEPYLQPCLIEGKHDSLDAVMTDPASVTYDLYVFGGSAEDALARCNADKASIKRLQEAGK
jgi:hypothetical protein